jgi:hypothetical protein
MTDDSKIVNEHVMHLHEMSIESAFKFIRYNTPDIIFNKSEENLLKEVVKKIRKYP